MRLNGYKIKELLSQDRRFFVYRGIRLADKQEITLKVCRIDPDSQQELNELQHEYQVLKQLNLPNVVGVYDLFVSDEQLILVLEELSGKPLNEYVANKQLPLHDFFQIAFELIDVIYALHLQHIVHKDINPKNIYIDPETLSIKFADFSLSAQPGETVTESLQVKHLGERLAYLSPEQTGRMNHPVDYRTDFYSLGVMFYQMLTGKLPFQTDDPLEMIHSHLAKIPVAMDAINPNIPTQLSAIVAKLLAKIPEERYASAAGLRADLVECQQQWIAKKKINIFTLGQQDSYDYLTVSQKLYGRELQIDQLMATFDSINQGTVEFMLISGYSGIGKTSLVRELYKPITERRGYFVSGKYDQLQKTTPYSAIIEAFQGLVRKLLAEPENYLHEVRISLLQALGKNGQIIIDVIPNVALIIGPQPPVVKLPPTEAQNRFMLTLQNFIRALAQKEHPLVVFLDDLQWIDSASLKLIQHLLSDIELRNFLLIGAYRDNEVTAEHPLMVALQKIKTLAVAVSQITLLPLQKLDIQYLLADSFNCQIGETQNLAEVLLNKTHGNPFFINQFLKLLYQKELLTFDYQKRSWKWDVITIQQEPITANVVDLLTYRIRQLSENTQNILRLAACIGHSFDLLTLSIISEQTPMQVLQGLYEAIIINLINPLEGSYKPISIVEASEFVYTLNPAMLRYQFMHDRIQQAAYQLIPEDVREQVHLQVGRLLLKQTILNENSEYLFEIVNHFTQSLKLITDDDEKKWIALYCLWAGKKAKASTAYQAARNYLQAGVDLFVTVKSLLINKNRLSFELNKELAVCSYLTGDFTVAENQFNQLLTLTEDKIEKIEIYKLYCEMLATLNQHTEAINKGVSALRLVGIHLPIKPNMLHILKAILSIKYQLYWQSVKKVQMVPITNPEYRVAIDLISQLFNSAFIVDQNLFLLLACTNVNLSLRHGYTEGTSFACIVYAFIIMHAMNWYREGMDFVELYSQLINQYSVLKLAGKNNFVLGCFIYPWSYSIKEAMDSLAVAYQHSYEVGDLPYANYSNLLLIQMALFAGQPLTMVQKNIRNTLSFIDKVKISDFHTVTLCYEYVLQCLSKDVCNIEELHSYQQKIMANKNITELAFFYGIAIKLCYMLGKYQETQEFGVLYNKIANYAIGMVTQLETFFYQSLAVFRQAKNKKQISSANKKIIKQTLHRLERWASWAPLNFQHYLYLLKAESARLNQQTLEAIHFYNKALVSAQEQDAKHIIAIINECAGEFYLSVELPEFAKLHLQKAQLAYQQWGTNCKSSAWINKYSAQLSSLAVSDVTKISTSETELALDSIDILSILKATQAISSEIRLDKLLQKLLYILLQNAGAQRGMLIMKESDEWYVEAEGSINIQRILLSDSQRIEDRNDIPLSLIGYVQRTKEKLIIQTKQEMESHFASDNYLREVNPHSILILPIPFQNQMRCILYLENRDTSYAFTPAHVQTVQLLASQAAISLENAHLYYQATHDPLTGLANRNLLYQVFNQAVIKAKRSEKIIAILFLDIDDFKKINDTLGHEVGDKILVHFAKQLKACLRDSDLAARLGGDEFIVMLEDVNDINQIINIAQRFLQQFTKPVHVLDHELFITSSIGISIYPNNGSDIQELLKQADITLYRVKGTGKGRYEFYTNELNEQVRQENAREIELRNALEQNQLCMYYQPIFTSSTHKLTHFEALIRWNHPKQGIIPAKQFIPLAEKSGLIVPIGEFVLQTVCRQLKTWQEMHAPIIPIAINISGQQFKQQNLTALIAKVIREENIDPRFLELEFTESVFIDQSEEVFNEIRSLKELNLKLSIDDFGTYYSSLSYLKRLPIDILKIDRSFIRDITENKDSQAIVLAIIAMAHSLNLLVIAEGVETPEQFAFLEKIGVDEMQGYYLGRPIPNNLSLKLLRNQAIRHLYEEE